jgi:hypothetical protein
LTSLPLTAALALGLAVLLHWWPRFAASLRLRISLATSLAGLGFLVAALRSEGLRESALPSLVLVGPATLTAHASASASLYYYVLTGFCLLFGFAGLVASDALARWLTPRPLLSSVAAAWLVTIVRVLLEKSAAPTALVEAAGVTWLAPVAGGYLATAVAPERPGAGLLLRQLVAYAYLVRGFVAIVGVVATRGALGTHYDVSPLTEVAVGLTGATWTFVAGSWAQLFWLTFVPQLLVWPLFTLLSGMAGGALAALFTRWNEGRPVESPGPADAPGPD